ncbi:hypothetical protein H5410_058633 [Solanum commersonii]|uniref:Disease resistance protein winged helix domain-containing protein n=1 Tax=Solanum commersonii TaxID=4109 RepID=A0A9J5WRE4_SOLCO|nr:hypothetical protein H5410_058633 [Solanum commersonii]
MYKITTTTIPDRPHPYTLYSSSSSRKKSRNPENVQQLQMALFPSEYTKFAEILGVPQNCWWKKHHPPLVVLARCPKRGVAKDETIEDLKTYFLSELRSRSLFERVRESSKRNEEEFLMHDLINDLAQVAFKTLHQVGR